MAKIVEDQIVNFWSIKIRVYIYMKANYRYVRAFVIISERIMAKYFIVSIRDSIMSEFLIIWHSMIVRSVLSG